MTRQIYQSSAEACKLKLHSMIIVYVIKSLGKKFRYVGITNNLESRLQKHNNGYNISTKSYRPFLLIHMEEFENYESARQREKFLKSGKGREYLDKL
jgi:putative endonuclease